MVPYVKKLIAGMAEEEVKMLLGVAGEITKLEDNTETIKGFLADAERRRITEHSVQRWVNKLKDAMYDATDILDLCQLEADKRRESEGGSMDERAPSCCRSLVFCLRNPVFSHRIGSRIKELKKRLDDIRKGADQFNFNINFGSYPDRRMTSQTEHSSRKAMSEFDESAIVGKNVENDMKLLIQELITDDNNDDNNIKVVSISGMGGIGKTTLAQKIFKERTIQEHFKTKIWLSIGKHFDEAELLRSAIKHAGRDHGEERDISLLVRTLTEALSASNFLVVMDDIWSDEAWSNVLSVPIRNANQNKPGSRVLVTTRLKDLASKMGESFHQHHVSPFDEEDAWSLLKKQLTPNQVVGIEELKNIGMDILKKCNGLPLAIKVIGGLLSMRYPSELEWKAVLESPAWSVGGLPEQLDNRLYLGYEDLSPQLKQCFLYCSLFPKGTTIIQNVITPMWISEGFIQPPGASSSLHDGYGGLEDIAIQYYRELINRNLIEPIAGYSRTGYRCTVHDVVCSFAEHMARDESLVVVDDKQASTTLRGSGSGRMLVRCLSLGQNGLFCEGESHLGH
ncbi:putative disease resistance protein RGA3 [Panicum miliaceum]|uniref:Disease resistance protein RGA3 n=1 Tax=Panicum miliaceum TaxID=4540 RepID=A0A3L6Q6S3_PANMI|nr:putative disease resistance protein RGA3 [Panicum miliaceum]